MSNPVRSTLFEPEAQTETPVYFTLEIERGGPKVFSLISSVLLHAGVIVLLASVRFPVAMPKPAEEAALSPTEIRIENKLYYVADLSGADSARRPDPAPAPRAKAAGASGPAKLTTPSDVTIDAPKIAMRAPKLGLADAQATLPDAPAPPPAPPRPEIKREAARTFIPPEVKRSPIAERTLIQPLSPPDLVPAPVPLPSFRVMTPQLPRLPKPFVSPGRPNPPPPQQTASITPMQMEIVSAPPAPVDLQPKLSLPKAAPPPAPAKPLDGPPPTPVGEAVNILSLSNRNVAVPDKLVVPQGNIAQESGNNPNVGPANSTVAANVAGANAGGASQAQASATPFRPSNATAGATGTGNANGVPGGANPSTSAARTAGSEGGTPSGVATAASGAANATTGAASGGTVSGGGGTSPAGPGRGSSGTGVGAATAGASFSGTNTTSPVGGTANGTNGISAAGVPGGSPTIAAPGGTGTGAGAGRAGQIINRPPTGTYDTVVVQSSPLDQYPESRGLLTGRPIYSVYISAGTARDWTLYFCVPNERPPANTSSVVKIGEMGTPVKAPYPTKLLRPMITLPSWEKYVLVHGYLTADGRFEGLKVVRSIQPDTDKALLASLAEWEFRSATREGNPIRVEFLLSIPAKGL